MCIFTCARIAFQAECWLFFCVGQDGKQASKLSQCFVARAPSLVRFFDGSHGVVIARRRLLAAALLASRGGAAALARLLLAALLFLLDHADEVLADVEALALHLENLGFAGRGADGRGEDKTERGRRGTTCARHAADVVALGTAAAAAGLVVEEEVVVGEVGAGARLVGDIVLVGGAQR